MFLPNPDGQFPVCEPPVRGAAEFPEEDQEHKYEPSKSSSKLLVLTQRLNQVRSSSSDQSVKTDQAQTSFLSLTLTLSE